MKFSERVISNGGRDLAASTLDLKVVLTKKCLETVKSGERMEHKR